MEAIEILNKLIEKKDLTKKESRDFLYSIMSGKVSSVQAGAILTALRIKVESVEEIVGFIRVMRKEMKKVRIAGSAVDVCGTGGDGSGTFNISTAVAFVTAGCGVRVVKHGNKAASSLCGSADVLRELGVNINLSPYQASEVLKKAGMVFLFAPIFHPGMKQVVLLRQELKIRTIFNLLGPFANPSGVKHQLIGVPNLKIALKMAKAGSQLGYKHLIIVTSDGLDEVSLSGKTNVFEIRKQKIKKYVFNPVQFGFKIADKNVFKGNNPYDNGLIIKNILNGEKSPRRDIVVLNSAFALKAADKAENIQEGIKLAENSIDTGSARLVLDNLIKETKKYA